MKFFVRILFLAALCYGPHWNVGASSEHDRELKSGSGSKKSGSGSGSNKNNNKNNNRNYNRNRSSNYNSYNSYNSYNPYSNQNSYNSNSNSYNPYTGSYGSNYNSYSGSSSYNSYTAANTDSTYDNLTASKNTTSIFTSWKRAFNKSKSASNSSSSSKGQSSKYNWTTYFLISLVGMSTMALVLGILFDRTGADNENKKRRSLSKSEKRRSNRRKKSKRSSSKRRKNLDDDTLEDSFQANEHYVGGMEGYENGIQMNENVYNENDEYHMDVAQVYYPGAAGEEYDVPVVDQGIILHIKSRYCSPSYWVLNVGSFKQLNVPSSWLLNMCSRKRFM